mmetsp:Transcript_44617/g.144934  ORF Transcript_44617/g.144934 Transcript_44617/m.144934 type:complete len:218 (-) Transcript_44617:790-1443(-)
MRYCSSGFHANVRYDSAPLPRSSWGDQGVSKKLMIRSDARRESSETAAARGLRRPTKVCSASRTACGSAGAAPPGPHASESARVSSSASSIAWQPPWPRFGIIGCTASPTSTTPPSAHERKSSGGRSYKSRCSTASGGVDSRTRITSSVQPACSSLRSAITLLPCAPVEALPSHESPARLVPGGLHRKEYHCTRPSPTSEVTKYFRGPMYTLYPHSK